MGTFDVAVPDAPVAAGVPPATAASSVATTWPIFTSAPAATFREILPADSAVLQEETGGWLLSLAYQELARIQLSDRLFGPGERTLREGLQRLPGDEKLTLLLTAFLGRTFSATASPLAPAAVWDLPARPSPHLRRRHPRCARLVVGGPHHVRQRLIRH